MSSEIVSSSSRHSPVYEEYSDEECYNCECDCHYVECDHDHDHDHDHAHDHEHDHVHDHTHDHSHGHDHGHNHYHDQDHHHDHGTCDCEEDYEHTCGPVTIPNPYLQKDPTQMTYQQALDAYRDERDNAARGLDEIGGMFKAAGWEPDPRLQKPLAEDPERLVGFALTLLTSGRSSTRAL